MRGCMHLLSHQNLRPLQAIHCQKQQQPAHFPQQETVNTFRRREREKEGRNDGR